ncbi:MAG TPA: type II toxin-antitoxin system RelE/ParE family toxin [Actinomycetota bacterium]|nr:type II toxin-antitoxin system RelE/ParE family toxin [Actinomycetota bacterium]
MAYEVELSSRAAREFLELPGPVQRRLAQKIDLLAEDPRPPGAEKLVGLDAFRIRVGDHRIVYLVDDRSRVVTIARIGHRRDVYRRGR